MAEIDPELGERLLEMYRNAEKVQVYLKGLIPTYALISSKDLPEDADLGPVFSLGGGLAEFIFVCEDITPEKYRKYEAFHEAVELLHGDHSYAIEKEFEAVDEDMDNNELAEFCHWRFQALQDPSLDELAKMVSPRIQRIIEEYQKR
ncbi:hypothetical protein KY343_00940 [Candidatus Woesearchaeota archaeon]|nr:hypothetical protein [Candidatus Woesearchaeota archaeon]